MRHSKDFLKKPIVTIDEGRYLGEVKDIYVDQDLTWLAGIHIGSEGLLRRRALVISRNDVVVFGIDAILVKNRNVVKMEGEIEEVQQWLRLTDLQGRAVDTFGGTKVGQIGDVVLDQEAMITGYYLSKVFVEGTIAADPHIPRSAMLDNGSKDGVMTIDLPKAEHAEAESANAQTNEEPEVKRRAAQEEKEMENA